MGIAMDRKAVEGGEDVDDAVLRWLSEISLQP